MMKHFQYLLYFFCLLPFALFANVQIFPKDPNLEAYLENMPWSYYKQYQVEWLGKFWVDDAKDVVKDTIKSGKMWETYIVDLIYKYVKPGDCVVDIGAHMGSITMAMSNLVGPTGKVYSFEGERQFFRELVENVKLNNRSNIFPYLCWIGDEDTEITTHLYYPSEYSRVQEATPEKEYTLPKRRLDSLELERVDFMKIDVECTEDAVLKGAYQTIMKHRPVMIIEIMGGFGYQPSRATQARIDRTIETLNAMDYDVSLIWVDDYLAIPKEKQKR